MHELSIALSILDVVEKEAQRHGGAQVAAIHVKLGQLSGVVKDALESAFELAREQSPFPNARLVIEEVPILLHCPTCESDRPAVSAQCLCCAVCGTRTGQIVAGKEMEITAMEII